MANPQSIGRKSPRFVMEIERGKIREFARATMSRNPAYLDEDRPPIPATFLMTQAFWRDERSEAWVMAELKLEGSLYAEQEYIFHGPLPRAGDRLTFQTVIEDIYRKPGRRGEMVFVVAVTRYWNRDDVLVAEGRATAVEVPPEKAREDQAGSQ